MRYASSWSGRIASTTWRNAGRLRHVDHVVGVVLDVLVAVRRDGDDVRASCADLLDVRDDLVVDVDVRRHDDDGRLLVEGAIGPCFISPAEYASVGMYEISLSLSAPSSATGSPM